MLHTVFQTLVFLSADTTRRGKVSHMTYPHQVLLEKIVEDLEIKRAFQTRARWYNSYTYIEVCEWTGIKCNENKDVQSINWSRMRLGGSIPFEHLPPSVAHFEAHKASLSGTLAVEDLQPPLESFCIGRNAFVGSVRFENLPQTMGTLDLSENGFEGPICLQNLPEGMKSLDISFNEFCGTIHFAPIPEEMHFCNLSHNEFRGIAQFGKFPPKLFEVDLQRTFVERPESIVGDTLGC